METFGLAFHDMVGTRSRHRPQKPLQRLLPQPPRLRLEAPTTRTRLGWTDLCTRGESSLAIRFSVLTNLPPSTGWSGLDLSSECRAARIPPALAPSIFHWCQGHYNVLSKANKSLILGLLAVHALRTFRKMSSAVLARSSRRNFQTVLNSILHVIWIL